MFNRIKTFYSDLKIKNKMFILTLVVLFTFSLGSLFILQYAFNIYNKEIYRQSAQSLSVSSSSIENELKKMERLSYQLATDPYVQSYLLKLKEADNQYEQFIIGVELRKRLLDLGGLNKYVESLQVYDQDDKEYATGNYMLTLAESRLQNIKNKTYPEKGGAQWIFPDETDEAIIVGREVKYYLNSFSLERIGIVTVRVDLEEIITDFSKALNEKGAQLVIHDGEDNQLYPSILAKEYILDQNEDSEGYKIIKDSDTKERFFITYTPTAYTKWTYMIITPYSNLFKAISSVRKAVFITYFVLFVIMTYFGGRFIGGITGPIESLNRKMKRVQTGNFTYFDEEADSKLSRDESGQMHDNFQKMMSQINFLIEENYKKQLVIKDSEFRTLQAQINPHFLYNTLESINWAAKMGGEHKISNMAESLGYILRASINTKESVITLEKELIVVTHYITIQSYRFEERLKFHSSIPDAYLHCVVPRFVLQPLVENAIRYGLQKMIGTCSIELSAKVENAYLIISVKDDGPGIDRQFLNQLKNGDYVPKGTGIGLKNINERIKILFGEDYGIEVESDENKGTTVQVILPFEGVVRNVQGIISG